MVMYGLVIIFSLYVMVLVGFVICDYLCNYDVSLSDLVLVECFFDEGMVFYWNFFKWQIQECEYIFFMESICQVWFSEYVEWFDLDSLLILLLVFIVSELICVFEIGFLIYLFFIVIDLIIFNIFLVMGMMMVLLMIIFLLFKLFLFVFFDGWVWLIYGLVISYGG